MLSMDAEDAKAIVSRTFIEGDKLMKEKTVLEGTLQNVKIGIADLKAKYKK